MSFSVTYFLRERQKWDEKLDDFSPVYVHLIERRASTSPERSSSCEGDTGEEKEGKDPAHSSRSTELGAS